jgi:hypothetical protein
LSFTRAFFCSTLARIALGVVNRRPGEIPGRKSKRLCAIRSSRVQSVRSFFVWCALKKQAASRPLKPTLTHR